MPSFPRIVKLELIVTEKCNASCEYCFEHGRSQMDMPASVADDAILQWVEWSRDSEWVGLTFIGGEPMMNYPLIRHIVAFAQEIMSKAGKQITFDMITNGTLLDETHCQFFSKEGLQYCLSLDGGPEINDHFRKMPGGKSQYGIVSEKMRMLKSYQHWQGSRITVTPETAASVCNSIRDLHEKLAINQFVIGFATGMRWENEQIAAYSQSLMEVFEYYLENRTTSKNRRLRIGILEVGQIEEAYQNGMYCNWGCGAGSGRIAVAPDGTLHGCARLAYARKQKHELVNLGAMSKGMDFQNRSRLLDHTGANRTKCIDCSLQRRCNGGCYAANLAETGNIYIPSDSYCKFVFAQIHAADYARRRLKELNVDNLYWENDVRLSE